MSDITNRPSERVMETPVHGMRDLENVAHDLCEKALQDARSQMHPLLQHAELRRLTQRSDFLQAFKAALEKRIARTLAAWQPGIQAVFRYDETRTDTIEQWDGAVHLLVKVPRVTHTVRALTRRLDQGLVQYFKRLAWERFHTRSSILQVHQVTPRELRHGVGYGAMFYAVYTAPVKVWPVERAAQ